MGTTKMSNFTKRKAERHAFCRDCDRTIKKGELMVSGYSHRNQGISMHFCINCAVNIGKLANDD